MGPVSVNSPRHAFAGVPLAIFLLFCATGASHASPPVREPIGIVTGAANALSHDVPVQPGQNLFAGDSFSVENGGLWITLADGTEITLGRQTRASFYRHGTQFTTVLSSGVVSLQAKLNASNTSVRSGNVFAHLVHANSEAVITATPKELVLVARRGPLNVSTSAGSVAVPSGESARFLNEAQDPASQTNPAQPPETYSKPKAKAKPASSTAGAVSGAATAGATGVKWGRVAVCATGGAAIGAVPITVKKLLASPDGADFEYAFVPAGAAVGAFSCAGNRFVPASGSALCQLTVDRTRITEGESITLSWTTPKGYSDVISDVGAIPNSGHITVTPEEVGDKTYELTAQGKGGTLVCMADVQVAAAAPKKQTPTCTITVDKQTLEKPGDEVSITWTLPPGATKAALTRPVVKDAMKEPQPLKVKMQSTEALRIVGSTPTSDFYCDTKVIIKENKCTITATPSADGSSVTLEWKTENATAASLQEVAGQNTFDPVELAKADLPNGSKVVTPEANTRYVLNVTGDPRPAGRCDVNVPVPWCELKSRPLNKGKVEIHPLHAGSAAHRRSQGKIV